MKTTGKSLKSRTCVRTPFKELLPPLSADELEGLRSRIKTEGGVHDSVLLSEADEILDGHNRYSIDRSAPVKIVKGSGDWSDARKKAFVVRCNLGRRNLSAEQIREICRPIAKELKSEGCTQAEIAKQLGVSRPTIAKWLGHANGHNVLENNVSTVYDCRIKVPSAARKSVAERVSAGESPTDLAAALKVSVKTVKRIVNQQTQIRERDERWSAAAEQFTKGHGIVTGDLSKLDQLLADDSVDLFISDPPYAKSSVNCYARLAELAARKLRPGGLCLAYAGHFSLPETMAAMAEQLEYWWLFAIRFAGASCAIYPRHIQNSWHPVLAFCKPPAPVPQDWLSDILAGGGREKEHHDWQQAESEAEYLIRKLTRPGDLVVDPFCGGGTVPAAAKGLGRRWLATEIDPKKAAVARKRIRLTTTVLIESATTVRR